MSLFRSFLKMCLFCQLLGRKMNMYGVSLLRICLIGRHDPAHGGGDNWPRYGDVMMWCHASSNTCFSSRALIGCQVQLLLFSCHGNQHQYFAGRRWFNRCSPPRTRCGKSVAARSWTCRPVWSFSRRWRLKSEPSSWFRRSCAKSRPPTSTWRGEGCTWGVWVVGGPAETQSRLTSLLLKIPSFRGWRRRSLFTTLVPKLS